MAEKIIQEMGRTLSSSMDIFCSYMFNVYTFWYTI